MQELSLASSNPTFPSATEQPPGRTLELLPVRDGEATSSASDFIPWAKREFLIMAQNRHVGDVISDLGEQQGLKVIVSDTVRGVVSGRFEGRNPARTLDQLARSFNLMWFYNQGTLFLYGAREIVTKLRTVYYANPESAISLLRSYGMVSSDGGVTTVPGSRSIMVSGPPEFVKLVDSVISSSDNEAQFHQQGETVIEVFPLKYAWAYDIPLGPAGNSGSTMIKGVATVLNNLVNFGGGGVATSQNYSTLGVPKAVQGALSPKDLSSVAMNGFYSGSSSGGASQGSDGSAPRQGAGVSGSPQMKGPGAPGAGADGRNASDAAAGPASQPNSYPEITADVRRNAVVIRDIRENMEFYRSAIEKLDVPARIIEISAAVVDVEAGLGRTLGVDGVAVNGAGYGVAGSAAGNQNFLNNASGLLGGLNGTNAVATGSSINGANPPNILGSGVFGTTRITAAINALEAENKARTLSRPTVMTLDNFGATINQQQTFYVSATGQYVSNLFNISSGLSLQVVPHIIRGKTGKEEIYMQVQIADGSITSQQVGQLPTVQQSTLTTQSLVKRNQSLLVGGLFVKVDQKQASGYPWLRKIPVLGTLFSVASSNKNYVERLFLITPKIIELSSSELGDFSPYFQPSPTEQEAIDDRKDPDLPGPTWVDHVPLATPTPTPRPSPSPTPKKSHGGFLGLIGGRKPSATVVSPLPSPTPPAKKAKGTPKASPTPSAKPRPVTD